MFKKSLWQQKVKQKILFEKTEDEQNNSLLPKILSDRLFFQKPV